MKKIITFLILLISITTISYSQDGYRLESNVMSTSTSNFACDCGVVRFYTFDDNDIFKINVSLINLVSISSKYYSESEYFVFFFDSDLLILCSYKKQIIIFSDGMEHKSFCKDRK